MARSSLDAGTYDFPEPLLPSMQKSASWTQRSSKDVPLHKDKDLQMLCKSHSAGQLIRSMTDPYKTHKLSETSRAFVRQRQQGMPKMVPEHIRKDFHRYSLPSDGPLGSKNLNQVSRYFEFKGYIEGAEHRAVTLTQFMQIYAYIESKCSEWKIALPQVTYNDVGTWLVQPATKNTNSALFEHIAEKAQAPTWFLSHWWGEPAINVMKCTRRHFSVRGLPSHVAYWVCAYACRESDLLEGIGDDPRQAAFYKAMQHAKFKTLLVMDVAAATGRPATPLRRIWCLFECAMCLDQVSAPLDIATVVPGKDEGIELVCSGLTKFERTSEKYLRGRGLATKITRELSFPDEIVKAGLGCNVKLALASSEKDRSSILKHITNRPEDAKPPREHEKYEELNTRMASLMSQAFWHRALSADKPTQEEPRKKFIAHLNHLANAIAADRWRTTLSLCLAGCQLGDEESLRLAMKCLPPTLTSVNMNLQATGITDDLLEMITGLLPKSVQNISLDLSGCEKVSDRGVMEFVQALSKQVQTLRLGLERTAVGTYLTEVAKTEPLDRLREKALTLGSTANRGSLTDPTSLDQQSEDKQSLLESLLRTKVSPDIRKRLLLDLVAAGQTGDRLEMNRRREPT